jgi:hypothetical protein
MAEMCWNNFKLWLIVLLYYNLFTVPLGLTFVSDKKAHLIEFEYCTGNLNGEFTWSNAEVLCVSAVPF